MTRERSSPPLSSCSVHPASRVALQRKAHDAGSAGGKRASGQFHGAPPIVHQVLSESGRPLDPRSRAFMEERFGYDFGRVRLHAGAKAAASAEAVNARAYTVGQHIVFQDGQLPSERSLGRRPERKLLAHELAHVIQQDGARTDSPISISPAGDRAEVEADRAADAVTREHSGRRAVPVGKGIRRRLQRQALDFRSGNKLGALTNPTADDNTKREVEMVLGWLLELQAIDKTTFDATKKKWAHYDRDDQIAAADLPPFIAAIKKNEQGSLPNDVANNFLALKLPAGRGVGAGEKNDPADVTAVQDALTLHGFLSSTSLADTEVAIKKFRRAVAEGKFGLDPMRPNERLEGRDKLAARTFSATGDSIPDVIVNAEQSKGAPPVKRTVTKEFAMFVPPSVTPDRNQVQIFFTPFLASQPGGAAGFLAQQGLRAESDTSSWILIGVPALDERDQPNFVTINTAEIQKCLAAAGRKRTDIDAIRLSAHSRGARGLEHTIGRFPGAKPSIDLKLVEKVTVFDASYQDLGGALVAQQKKLTALADPKKSNQFAPGAVQLYDVTVKNVSGLPGTKMDEVAIRGLSYARLIEEGVARGDIVPNVLNILDPAVKDATQRLLKKLPPRGTFTTKNPAPMGRTNVLDFIAANKADLTTIQDPAKGVKNLIGGQSLDRGANFSAQIDAHHWFVAELAHEAVE